MNFADRVDNMAKGGKINPEEANAIKQSLASLETSTPKKRKELPTVLISSISVIALVIVAILFNSSPAPQEAEVIQDVSQTINQPGATGSIDHGTSGLLILILLTVAPTIGLLLLSITKYNLLVRLDECVQTSAAVIQSSLQERHDLVPDLVEIAKKATSFEGHVQEGIAEERNKISQLADALDAVATEEGAAQYILPKLSAVVEAYPKLESLKNLSSLQNSISRIEQSLKGARNMYNSAVLEFNSETRTIFGSFVASISGLKLHDYFAGDADIKNKQPISLDEK